MDENLFSFTHTLKLKTHGKTKTIILLLTKSRAIHILVSGKWLSLFTYRNHHQIFPPTENEVHQFSQLTHPFEQKWLPLKVSTSKIDDSFCCFSAISKLFYLRKTWYSIQLSPKLHHNNNVTPNTQRFLAKKSLFLWSTIFFPPQRTMSLWSLFGYDLLSAATTSSLPSWALRKWKIFWLNENWVDLVLWGHLKLWRKCNTNGFDTE